MIGGIGVMNTLRLIADKYGLDLYRKSPIEIPNVGRDDLAALFAELGFTSGAEIGVEQGLYSETLCKVNPGLRLYSIDAWKAYKGYRDHVTQGKLDGFYQVTQERLSSYRVSLIRKFSVEALQDFNDGTLDFVYIDANHELPFVMFDIIEWSKKVRKDGIVAGHDYYKSTRFDTKNHVTYAVNAYVQSYRIHPWFLAGSKEKRLGETRDDSRSWMLVKQ